jgi:hypothetical protein
MKRTIILALAALALAGCATVQVDPKLQLAVTRAPFEEQHLMSRISVPNGSPMVAATVDGKPAFCPVALAFFPAVDAPRSICFFVDEANAGYLDKGYILGTLHSQTFDAHVPYALMTESEVAEFEDRQARRRAIVQEAAPAAPAACVSFPFAHHKAFFAGCM